MAITCKTPLSEIESYLNEQLARREAAMVSAMQRAAERVINVARSTNSYKDQTGNLRSSIGGCILKDGAVIWQGGFEVVKEGQQGETEGKKFLQEVAGKFPQGIALVVVAGKDYAIHVENKGYDVLSGAELAAKSIVPKMLQQLNL